MLETAIGVLQAVEYKIKSIDRDKGYVSATKGNAQVMLTVSNQQNPYPCRVSWVINKNSPPGIHDNPRAIVSCVGFRPKLEKALGTN